MNPIEEPTILGIDPGTRYLGVAVLRGRRPLAGGVHTLRNGDRPRDVIDQARKHVLSYVAGFAPCVVAIEKPIHAPTKRASLVSVIAQELRARSREVGAKVLEIPPREVRRIVVGDPHAKKWDVAHAIVRMGFEELRDKLPRERPHPVLGYGARDKYWLHLFDAVAVALAVPPMDAGQRTGIHDRPLRVEGSS